MAWLDAALLEELLVGSVGFVVVVLGSVVGLVVVLSALLVPVVGLVTGSVAELLDELVVALDDVAGSAGFVVVLELLAGSVAGSLVLELELVTGSVGCGSLVLLDAAAVSFADPVPPQATCAETFPVAPPEMAEVFAQT